MVFMSDYLHHFLWVLRLLVFSINRRVERAKLTSIYSLLFINCRFIADMDSETVYAYENKRSNKKRSNYWKSQVAGRGNNQPLLINFFLSDTNFITFLRVLLWLTPCPEISCLLLDWSRMKPQGGGMPQTLLPLVSLLTSGRLNEVKKLMFTQQLVSGLPDSGYWGGK